MINNLFELEIEEAIDTVEAAEVGGRFTINDLDSANWAFRKLAAIEKKRAEIQELADKEIERIREWEQQEVKRFNNSIEFFEGILTEYFVRQREVDPKFKISTPYGKVSARKQQPKWVYEDEKILESLKEKELDKFIRVKEEVNKADLKEEVQVLQNVCVLNGQVLGNVKPLDDEVSYLDIETGEIYDLLDANYEIYEQLIVYDGKFIEGIKVEERPDLINIKVEV